MKSLVTVLFVSSLAAQAAAVPVFPAVDADQKPLGAGVRVLPEKMLRGFDPITAYFDRDMAKEVGPADDGVKTLKIEPAFPGAWIWIDRKTLQFRPSEPWPALARFAASAGGETKVLVTLMQPPDRMRPENGTTGLAPFRSIALQFPAPLSMDSLRRMLRFELREQPGLADSPRRPIRDFELAATPRESHRAPAEYIVTFPENVEEGRVLVVTAALALGDSDKTLWSARVSTREPFRLLRVSCGSSSLDLAGGRKSPKDLAMSCGNNGGAPALDFSAAVANLTLGDLRRLVRLEPSVTDLDFSLSSSRVDLRGSFSPDVLYRMSLAHTPLKDETGRALEPMPPTEVFFYLGWKSPYLRWDRSNLMVETNGPRVVPMVGYGDARADVRVHKIDPLHPAMWPFPASPVSVSEETDPPFPGEEPAVQTLPARYVDGDSLLANLRLLGSPLVSRVVDLPKGAQTKGGRFGLDLGAILDGAVGPRKPGTYLVGMRRLTGTSERSWVRMQVTNLSVTTVAERSSLDVEIRSLDKGEAVAGATIHLDGTSRFKPFGPVEVELKTNAGGQATIPLLQEWGSLTRVYVKSGDDVLVLNPDEPPPAFSSGHWAPSSNWFDWLVTTSPPPRADDRMLGFLTSERPVYKPGETVHLKGWLRKRTAGKLGSPGNAADFAIEVVGPDGNFRKVETARSQLAGFSADFTEKDSATGEWTAMLVRPKPREVLATRTFKVEAYRLPTFEVQVSGPLVARLDAPFKVKAVARYFAGGNVAGAPIKWQVTRRPTWYTPKGREGFLFASSTQFSRPGQATGPTTTSENDTLADDGTDEITVNPAVDPDGTPRIYRFEATITGADDQIVNASQEVRALPPFVLGLKLDRYVEDAKAVTPQLIAVGVDEKTIAGQDVTVRLLRRIWHSHLRETNFSTGEAKYVTEREDRKVAEKIVKTTAEPLAVPFPITEAGVYVVELEARDRLGRVQTLEADLYVGGKGAVAWQKQRDGVFTVTPDKAKYRAGDVAKLVLQSPFQEGWALVVTERPERNDYTWLRVSGGKATAEVKILPENVPNLAIHAVLMRGRIGEGPGDDSRFRPQTVASTIELEIEPATNLVNVAIALPESARPSTTVDVGLKLTDDRGKPISGEVTLWLVDEAALTLAKEGPLDPLTAMIIRNARTTSIRDTRNTVIGRLLGLDELPGGDGEESEDLLKGKLAIRRNFQTVPYWAATIQVPASGELTVPVKLADDLTNFAVRALAVSGYERFGFQQGKLRVRLPVLVQPVAPRFARSGDKLFVGALARVVEGPGGPASLQIDVTGPATGGQTKQSATLDALKPNRFEVPIEVKSTNPRDHEVLVIRSAVLRKADGAGDAVESRIPVLADRNFERFAKTLKLVPGAVTLTAFPETPRPGSADTNVAMTSVPGLLTVISGLESLRTTPHQSLTTKAAKLLPALELGGFLKRIQLTEYAADAEKHTRSLVDDLELYQDDNGLFADWPGSRGNELVTVWVLQLLQGAKRTGITVNPNFETRAVNGLRRVLRTDWPYYYPTLSEHQRVSALRGLAIAGQLDSTYASDLFAKRNNLDAEALAELADGMLRDPRLFSDKIVNLRTDLWDRVIFQLNQGKPRFEGIKWGRASWWGGYLSTETSTISSMLSALVRLTPSDQRLLLMRDVLVGRADPITGFGASYANWEAVEALSRWLDVAQVDVPGTKLRLEGEKTLEVAKGSELASFHTTSTALLKGSLDGAAADVRVAMTYLPAEPGSQAKARGDGFNVSRTFTVYRPDNSTPETFPDDAGARRTLKIGDIVEIHARIESPVERFHVAFVVPFAAAFEPLNPELATAPPEARPAETDSDRPTYVQRLDDEVRYVFERLNAGTHAFHFRLRVTSKGEFNAPPAWGEQIYLPGPYGRSAGHLIVVSE